MTVTTARVAGELVASVVPGANEALHLGHLLYAAEIRVTTARDWVERSWRAARIQAKHEGRLREAEVERDRLDAAYIAALAEVRTANPETADLVDDTVWRVHLVNGED